MHLVAVNWRDLADPDAGGAEIHLHEILTRMVERGHRVTFFSCRFPGSTAHDHYDGIDFHRVGNWWNANFTIPSAVKRYLAKDPANLVIEDINKIPFFLPRVTDIPVMPVIPHLFGKTVYRETNPVFGTYVYLWEQFIPSVFKRSNFAVISPSTKDDLVARGIPSANVDVVLCGLDHSRFYRVPELKRFERPTLVHFGRVRKYKGIDIVMRAFARVRTEIANAQLIIVGDGPELPALKQLADKLQIASDVDFRGRISTEDMVRLLNQCHLFLNASPKEGWGLTVVEANACGVPVIGSDRPGLKDSIHHEKTGYLVPYGDDAAFADRALQLLRDPELWQRMSDAGLEWARSLTWDKCADEMEALFLRDAR